MNNKKKQVLTTTLSSQNLNKNKIGFNQKCLIMRMIKEQDSKQKTN